MVYLLSFHLHIDWLTHHHLSSQRVSNLSFAQHLLFRAYITHQNQHIYRQQLQNIVYQFHLRRQRFEDVEYQSYQVHGNFKYFLQLFAYFLPIQDLLLFLQVYPNDFQHLYQLMAQGLGQGTQIYMCLGFGHMNKYILFQRCLTQLDRKRQLQGDVLRLNQQYSYSSLSLFLQQKKQKC